MDKQPDFELRPTLSLKDRENQEKKRAFEVWPNDEEKTKLEEELKNITTMPELDLYREKLLKHSQAIKDYEEARNALISRKADNNSNISSGFIERLLVYTQAKEIELQNKIPMEESTFMSAFSSVFKRKFDFQRTEHPTQDELINHLSGLRVFKDSANNAFTLEQFISNYNKDCTKEDEKITSPNEDEKNVLSKIFTQARLTLAKEQKLAISESQSDIYGKIFPNQADWSTIGGFETLEGGQFAEVGFGDKLGHDVVLRVLAGDSYEQASAELAKLSRTPLDRAIYDRFHTRAKTYVAQADKSAETISKVNESIRSGDLVGASQIQSESDNGAWIEKSTETDIGQNAKESFLETNTRNDPVSDSLHISALPLGASREIDGVNISRRADGGYKIDATPAKNEQQAQALIAFHTTLRANGLDFLANSQSLDLMRSITAILKKNNIVNTPDIEHPDFKHFSDDIALIALEMSTEEVNNISSVGDRSDQLSRELKTQSQERPRDIYKRLGLVRGDNTLDISVFESRLQKKISTGYKPRLDGISPGKMNEKKDEKTPTDTVSKQQQSEGKGRSQEEAKQPNQ